MQPRETYRLATLLHVTEKASHLWVMFTTQPALSSTTKMFGLLWFLHIQYKYIKHLKEPLHTNNIQIQA